jgi:hypothetical protein
VRAADLWDAADALAAERSGDRAANRSRLDAAAARALHDLETARSQRDHLDASRVGLIEGARWARDLELALPALHHELDEARAHLELRQAEQRAARQGLDRVLEQRAAATAATEEADRELGELVGVGMDELGLRRELEASGQAVRSAQAAHTTALARLQALEAERVELAERIAVLEGRRVDDDIPGTADALVAERVREWLSAWVAEAGAAGLDPQAQDLADAWTDLLADLAELSDQAPKPPSQADLDAAEARAAAAAQALAELDAAAQPLAPAVRAAIDEAHDAVVAAEEQIGRRFGGASARRKLEEARDAERALLDQHGFAGYLDVVLSGGRSEGDGAQRLAAERAYLAATKERDALLVALQGSPELEYLHSERARLQAYAVELLGGDPGDAVVGLLRAHPLLPGRVVEGLREALAQAGVCPVGVPLDEAAAGGLSAHDRAAEARDVQRDASGRLGADLDALAARQQEITGALAEAEQAEAHAAEQLDLALRSVGAFEAELSVRAGEDAQRLQRFAAAEQLRTQIEALAATLARAEGSARDALDEANARTIEAEVVVDRGLNALTEHARQARRLAAELPIDQRPEGDPLTTLAVLADRLEHHAEVLVPELEAAEHAVAAATTQADQTVALAEAASTGLEGPLLEDLRDSLVALLVPQPDRWCLLDEPFAGLDERLRGELLALVLEHSSEGSLVFLTEDADVLGWAIELPADAASVIPAEALLATIDLQPTTEPPSDDLAIPTASAPRWAGQR